MQISMVGAYISNELIKKKDWQIKFRYIKSRMVKRILLTLIILTSFTVCKWEKNEPTQIIEAKLETKKELTELEKEEKLRSEINQQYLTALAKCSANIDAVSNFNSKTEFWRICETNNGKRIIQVDSYKDSLFYEEVYYEENRKLIYAEESINYMPINHFTLQSWTCQFYVKNGNLISLISLGHGKTEDEEWDPEEIFEMHRNRLAELDDISK